MDPDILQMVVEGVSWYITFLFSVTLHEAAHAWAAKIGGDPTAYYGGQVSLNPIPHIRRQPFGMVLMPIFFLFQSGWPMGFASAPYDPAWAARYPKRAGWMAIAGPASNLSLVLVAAALIRLGIAMGYCLPPSSVSLTSIADTAQPGFLQNVVMLVSMFFSLNLVLTVLNLFPLPPLDGSGALALLLDSETNAKFQNFTRQPALGLMGLIIAWHVFGKFFGRIFIFALQLLYPGVEYQ